MIYIIYEKKRGRNHRLQQAAVRSVTFLSMILLLLMFMVDGVCGSYPMDVSIETQIPMRTNAASFVRGRAMYIYGGEGRGNDSATNDFFSLSFNAENGDLIYEQVPVASEDKGPRIAGGRAVILPDNNTVLLFGGYAPYNENITAVHLLCYQYTFDNQVWAPIPVNATGEIPEGAPELPTHRESHTATLGADGLVYIYGGIRSIRDTALVGDFWAYDPSTRLFSRRELISNIVLYAHIGIPLPDGTIVYATGLSGYAWNFTTDPDSALLTVSEGLLFNTADGSWQGVAFGGSEETLIGVSSRVFSTAVLGPEQRYIYFFGGSDLVASYRKHFRRALSILDTQTWNYTIPASEGVGPSRRAMACAAILTNEYMVIAQGGARSYYYGDVNVVRLPTLTTSNDLPPEPTVRWVSNIITGAADDMDRSTSESVSRGIIAAVVIVSVLAAAMLVFLAWRFRHRLRWLIIRIHSDIWSPRTGEPHWAEISRLITKVILAFLFVAFFVFVVIQVMQSPKATFTITEVAYNEQVDIPEIRFCFDGYQQVPDLSTGETFPLVSCVTDAGAICDEYIYPLNMSDHQPFFYSNLGAVTCYLFLPDTLHLAANVTLDSNNGSMLHFSFHTSPAVAPQAGRTHISFYPRGRDPNRAIYLDGTELYEKQLYTDAELSDWVIDDFNDFHSENIVDVDINDAAFIHYQLQEYQYLQNTGWNYIGFSPVLNSTPEVEITSRVQPMNLEGYSPMNGQLNEVIVKPASFNTVRIREQKIYSLLNALGFLGGLFGLFVAFQALMFGHRPNSPWGVVHRWSIGTMKRSLSRELTSRFDLLKTPVPLMNPVHRRFSTINLKNYGPRELEDVDYMDAAESGSLNTPDGVTLAPGQEEWDEQKRLEQVEERMQLLELLFKSYYIDDEVFRRLDRALKRPDVKPPSVSKRGMSNFLRGNGVGLRSRNNAADDAHESHSWLATNGGGGQDGATSEELRLSPAPYIPRLASTPHSALPIHEPNENINNSTQKQD
ncbi:hypothetical protein BDB00DRAFT_812680 [Zychaea mexicana]|uniref:uncharacterized protein n=1 Tax=Zychaea mexicana TaxID=64656 RepID=UPI0022FDD4EF|nr:uncharacterized protein BDB00DRAFT_812680 [Zychaea mexicana]KAI9495623.1 hypothetical protein BDB00DRAFT_812680 [Zychaea mexicana]